MEAREGTTQNFKPTNWAETYTRFRFFTVSPRSAANTHKCASGGACASLRSHPFVNVCHLGVVLMGLSAGADLPPHLLSQDGLILSDPSLLVYTVYLSAARS